MKMCHIAPTAYIDSVAPDNQCFLTLAHLVEKDPEYIRAHHRSYRSAQTHGVATVRIMDNSGFEFYKEHGAGYVFDPDRLIELGTVIGAEYIVLPDYPAQHSDVTVGAAIRYAPMFRKAGFQTFFCPQSIIGDLNQYLHCVDWAASALEVDYIGISILGVPNAFGVERNPLQRYNCRAWLMKLLYEGGTLDKIRHHGKKLHFLGMVDGPNEIALVKDYADYIDSWDSSAAVWAGINGIRFDQSPTGLIRGKFEKPVDFNASYSPGALMDVDHNIQYINQLLSEY